MRALAFVPALLCAAAAAAAAAQAPAADPLPLRPATVGISLAGSAELSGRFRIQWVAEGSPAARAGITADSELLEVDGRPVLGLTVDEAMVAVSGPPGSAVEVTVVPPGGGMPRTVRLARADLFSPLPGGAEARVATPHFVVHHAPGSGDEARALAARAERAYAARGLPRATGRRAHLYLAPPGHDRGSHRLPPPLWGAWVEEEREMYGRPADAGKVFGYVAYGLPGRLGEEKLGPAYGWDGPAARLHREAAQTLITLGGADARIVQGYPERLYVTGEGASLREFLRVRYGDHVVRALWTSDESLDAAARRTLGKSELAVMREWETAVRSLGPRTDAGLSAGSAGVALLFIGLTLLAGVGVAARKEVG